MGERVATTRPRPSLSCVTCRRRKVRCTKEQPSCHSCVRTNTTCKYDKDVWKGSKTQAKQKQSAGKHRNTKSTQPSTNEDALPPDKERTQWTPTYDDTQARPNMAVTGTYQKRASERPLDHGVSNSPATPDQNHSVRDYVNTTDVSSSIASEPYSSHVERSNIYGGFSSDSSWTVLSIEALAGSLNQQGNMQLLDPEDVVLHQSYLVQPNNSHTSTDSSAQRTQSANDIAQQDSSNAIKFTSKDPCRSNDVVSETAGQTPNLPGYLSIRSGARVRYIGSAFWAYVKGNEPACESFLGGPQDAVDGLPQPHIDSLALATILFLIPPKPVCDSLLLSFLLGVRPIYPLIHLPTFDSDYNAFWHWYQNLDTALPAKKLIDDPTFLCLLFNILYCGAATASSEFWAAGALCNVKRGLVLEQLMNASSASLRLVQHLRFPTFNTLVASLLMHSCLRKECESNDHSGFVGAMVRISQTMGLHLEASQLGLDAVSCEMRRRVWWHVLWLDLQHSIFTGSPLYFHDHETRQNVAMVSENRDRDISGPQPTGQSMLSGPGSASMLFAIGRFEFTRFERLVFSHLYSTGGLEGHQNEINDSVRKFELIINTLIARMPAQGIPEQGSIPYRLANASPLSRQEVYWDHFHEPTAFTTWARIMLSMMKTEIAIFLGRLSLELGNTSKQGQSKWHSVVQLCTSYLCNFCQLIQVPAFRPYVWFCYTYSGPLQAVFLTLRYLQTHRDSGTEVQALHLVDEVIDFFVSEDDSPHPSSIGKQWQADHKTNEKYTGQTDSAWKTLKTTRTQLSPRQDCQQSREEHRLTPISLPASSHKAPTPHSNTTSKTASSIGEPDTAVANGSYWPAPNAIFPPAYLLRPDSENGLGSDGDVDMMMHHTGPDA